MDFDTFSEEILYSERSTVHYLQAVGFLPMSAQYPGKGGRICDVTMILVEHKKQWEPIYALEMY